MAGSRGDESRVPSSISRVVAAATDTGPHSQGRADASPPPAALSPGGGFNVINRWEAKIEGGGKHTHTVNVSVCDTFPHITFRG